MVPGEVDQQYPLWIRQIVIIWILGVLGEEERRH